MLDFLHINPFIIYGTLSLLLALLISFYFKLAERFKIVDKPNYRSSHNTMTIRGAGVIFPVALLLHFVFFSFSYPYFLAGLVMIGSISFADDVKPVSNRLRIITHILAAGLMFFQLGIIGIPLYMIFFVLFVTIGTINAINFMDGINGITGAYVLVALSTLWYINEFTIVDFTNSSLIITSVISVLIFSFYNFRKRAKCFAGDVGSVSIAFILIFIVGQLIIVTNDFSYVLLLFVYGLDTSTTIVFRIIRKESVFDAHRSHYYQFLANEKKIPHLYIALGYALVQVVFNVFLILFIIKSLAAVLVFTLTITCFFIALRFKTEGRMRLLIAQ